MSLATGLLHTLPSEIAHRAAIAALKHYPFGTRADAAPHLRVEAFGLSFPNPLGLAAGFDKSAEAVDAVGRLGFGFVEIGTLTPQPQAGNPKPRLFRLPEDHAIVNRMGFNNDGYAAGRDRLARARRAGVVGVNIGPNKDAADRVADFVRGVETFAALADYFTINISSPNTPGLRDLHAREELAKLLEAALDARARSAPRRPVLLKISPDVSESQLDDVIEVALDKGVDGLIVSNTSVRRPASLKSPAARETGGLSGRPIFELSTRLLARVFLRCEGKLPIVGVGGIEDAKTALAKIEAGATLVQIYTGFVYRGPGIVGEILRGLAADQRPLQSRVGSRAREISAGAAIVA